MNILITHFGLLLKECILDSIGHDLWGKYNVICLLWMIRYISLLTKHIYTMDSILVHSVFFNSTRCRNGVDTSITLDAATWNCAGGELSSCVINTIPLDRVL